MKIARIALVALMLFGCSSRQSVKSRAYLNCVYHHQYELGEAKAAAEDACR